MQKFHSSFVTLNDIPVMCVVAENGIEGAKQAFLKLETKLPTLKQRKFYGVLEGRPETGVYRACVAIKEGDDPQKMGLETWTIPGGKYARAKIKDWEKHVDQIGPTVGKLIDQYGIDERRPTIELYRSEKELFVFVPIQ